MNVLYRFFLEIDGDRQQAYPIYGDGLSKDYTLESNQLFFRVKLSGKLKFVKADYAFIMSYNFDETVHVELQKSNDLGKTWSDYFKGKFMRTDCTIMPNDETIEVELTSDDEYESVLAGLDKEYNLLDLAPEIMPVSLVKRPIVQIYSLGDSVVSSYIGAVYWEQECESITDETTLNSKHGFAKCAEFNKSYRILVSDDVETMLYIRERHRDSHNNIENDYDVFHGESFGISYTLTISRRQERIFYELMTYDTSSGTESVEEVQTLLQYTVDQMKNSILSFENAVAKAEVKDDNVRTFYIRVLHDYDDCDGSKVNITNTTEFGSNHNMSYATPIDALSWGVFIYEWSGVSSKPTKYGLMQPKEYYSYPEVGGAVQFDGWLPISSTSWGMYSYWFAHSVMQRFVELAFRKRFLLRHTYPIYSCISKLLDKIAPGITHENSESYSKFFYSDFNPISHDIFTLCITQNTNVLKGEYDRPAQKMIVKLSSLLQMLRDCFNVYWYIEDGKFKLEHISFFNNSNSYGSVEVGYDTTAVVAPRNKKPWSFCESEYSFDLDNMPERYEFNWSDESSEPFRGLPINILSKYVKKGDIEDITVSGFVADIDLMLSRPDIFSDDGNTVLAVLNTCDIVSNSEYAKYVSGTVPVTLNSSNTNVDIQLDITQFDRLIRTDYMHATFTLDTQSETYIGLVTLDSEKQPLLGHSYKLEPGRNVVQLDIPKNAAFFRFEYRMQDVSFSIIPNETLISADSGSSIFATAEMPISDCENIRYIFQNGLMAFIDLVPKYYRDNLPAGIVEINGTTEEVTPGRYKKQTLEVPSGEDDINPYALVKTSIGTGKIHSLKINLSSRIAKIELRHETE